MQKERIHRRDFMKSTLASIGGLFFLPPLYADQETRTAQVKGKERKFVYRTLGKTGMKLPVINMGVMNSDNPNLVRAALDVGITHLDTAHSYMRGRNEEMIGEVIKGRPRDSFTIGSKVSLPKDRATGLYKEGATTDAFLEKLNLSLKRLGLEYVDILFHHGISQRETTLFEPVLKALEKAKKDGKIRFVGISTHMNEPEVIRAAVDSKRYDVILTSYNYQQKHYLKVREAIAAAAQAGLGIIGMKAIRGGFRRSPTVESAPAAIKWVLQDPNVHTVVPGFTTFEQMETDLAVMEDIGLTDEDKKVLKKEASLPSLYCQGCGQCLRQCIEKLPIPDLMRACMYNYGYRNPALAQDLILSLNLSATVCDDCTICTVKCSTGFNVSEKVRDIVRLRDVPTAFLA